MDMPDDYSRYGVCEIIRHHGTNKIYIKLRGVYKSLQDAEKICEIIEKKLVIDVIYQKLRFLNNR
jgi:hypothetical protein